MKTFTYLLYFGALALGETLEHYKNEAETLIEKACNNLIVNELPPLSERNFRGLTVRFIRVDDAAEEVLINIRKDRAIAASVDLAGFRNILLGFSDNCVTRILELHGELEFDNGTRTFSVREQRTASTTAEPAWKQEMQAAIGKRKQRLQTRQAVGSLQSEEGQRPLSPSAPIKQHRNSEAPTQLRHEPEKQEADSRDTSGSSEEP